MIFPQLIANGLVTGCLYALVAVGLSLIYNTTRVFHFAHGGIYAAGAYLCYIFLVLLSFPLYLSIVAGVLLTGALGWLVDRIVYAPLAHRRASTLAALLSSLGLYVVLVNLIAMYFGSETKLLSLGMDQTVAVGPVTLTCTQLAQILSALFLLGLVLWLLQQTSWGMKIRALRDNPTLAVVMGINPTVVRGVVLALGSALAGVAAILTAFDVGMDPQIGLPALLTATVAMIIGGVATFQGAIFGALLLGVIQSLVIWLTSARWADAVTFALLITVLLIRPQGLLGKSRRVEEPLG